MIIDAFDFPELPKFSARFRSIYFEPIVGSGERFTIGVMAQADTGEFRVVQTLNDKTMVCMYGKQAANVRNFVFLILDSARQYFTDGGNIEHWQPPMAGVSIGNVEKTYSSGGMEGVLFQAISTYASLYNGALIDDAIAEINGVEDPVDDETEQKTASLVHQVKTLFIASGRQDLYWQREVTVKNNAMVNIDYLGAHYNANLSNFDVKRIKPAFNAAKAKLLDLEILREKRLQETISAQQTFELLIGLKKSANSEAKERYEMLEQLADSIELRVIKQHTPEDMLERIIKMDIAA